jgi:surface antigen
MASRVGPIFVVLTGLLSAPAQAQLLFGPAWESNITLTQEDLDLIHRTVDTQIHGKPVGTAASWSNPNTGNAGTIKLVRKLRKGNLQCEQVAYTLTTTKKAVEPEHYVFNSCLTPEGWKIARSSDKYESGAFYALKDW